MTRPDLTELQWAEVFRLRCRSKCGERLSDEEQALVRRAYASDPTRYAAGASDVFNATAPFGSQARAKR